MDKLKLGEVERLGDAIYTTCQVNGSTVPALELRLEGPVDAEFLQALEQQELEIYGADGLQQGSYVGYHTVMRKSVVVARVSDAQQEVLRLKAQLAALEQQLGEKSA